MKNFKKVDVTLSREVLESIQCDKCKKIFDPHKQEDYIEIGEILSIRQTCGYGSIFGDMNEIELDLCQHCVNKLLGGLIRIRDE